MPRRNLHYNRFFHTPASPTCMPNNTFCLCPMPRRNLHYGQFYNAIVVQGARAPVPPDMPSDYALLMQRCAVQTPLHAAAAWHATRNLHMEACCLWCLDRLTLCLRPGAPYTYATASRAAA